MIIIYFIPLYLSNSIKDTLTLVNKYTRMLIALRERRLIIAGAFGIYIDVASAINIGMLPSLPLNRFYQVGNAAGMGAKLALISQRKRAEAQTMASRVNYIGLASAPNFKKTCIQANYLGRYKMKNGKRKEIN